jgi:NADPH:quinone reductase-like Zn-dependent oxidoreductase
MRAIVMEGFGGVDVLKLADVPVPEISDGEMLVEVKAVGINPIDYVARAVGGPLRDMLEKSLPVILGWDIAGIVSASKSEKFKAGDRVFALSRFPQIAGGYAEFAAVSADEAVLIPKKLNFEQAAAVPLAALTAWQSLIDTADLQAGQRVLIHAAAGGVGHFAVQIAKHLGAYVIGSASANNFDFVKSLGADEVVDYNEYPVGEQVSDVDVVLHALPPELRESASWPCVKEGGIVVSLKGPIPEEEAAQYKARGAGMGVKANAEQLGKIAGLLDDGTFKLTLDHTFPFDKVAKAHLQLAEGHTRGKIVIVI